MGLLLTDEEREKFASYLEREADNNDNMARNLDSLPGVFPDGMSKLLRTDAAAYAYVAAKLRAVESQ